MSGTAGAAGGTALRDALLRFLAHNERPGEWTFFEPARRGPPGRAPVTGPDIVIEAAGRVAYVEPVRQGGGPPPPEARSRERLARRRGAEVFVVRSVPELERALAALGIALRPQGRLARELHRPGAVPEEGGHVREP